MASEIHQSEIGISWISSTVCEHMQLVNFTYHLGTEFTKSCKKLMGESSFYVVDILMLNFQTYKRAYKKAVSEKHTCMAEQIHMAN